MNFSDVAMLYQPLREAMQRAVSAIVENLDKYEHAIHDWDAMVRAEANGERYWIDHSRQPRRAAGKKPILHNGRKP